MEKLAQADYKKIGILGGMSAESTVTYYQHITRLYTERYNDYRYPEIIIYSMTFQDYADWPTNGKWDLIVEGLTEASRRLEQAGADFIVIACNTVHKVFDQIQANVGIPMMSMTDVVKDAILEQGINCAGLLGTQVTMESDFYQSPLARDGIEVIIPETDEREMINTIIYSELVNGVVEDSSRKKFMEVIESLSGRGAGGIILGCTELGMMITEANCRLPLFDSTLIHAEAALNRAIY